MHMRICNDIYMGVYTLHNVSHRQAGLGQVASESFFAHKSDIRVRHESCFGLLELVGKKGKYSP